MADTVRKWKRLCPGKYATALDDGHALIVERHWQTWHAYLEGGYAAKAGTSLRESKIKALADLPGIYANWEKRQADDATKNAEAAAKHAAEKKREAALESPTYDPTAGLSWFEWAERFVGCSAAEVRKADKGRERRWKWWRANAV